MVKGVFSFYLSSERMCSCVTTMGKHFFGVFLYWSTLFFICEERRWKFCLIRAKHLKILPDIIII